MMTSKLKNWIFGNAKKIELQNIVVKLNMNKSYLFILHRYDNWTENDLNSIVNIGKNSRIAFVDNSKEPIYRILEISNDK